MATSPVDVGPRQSSRRCWYWLKPPAGRLPHRRAPATRSRAQAETIGRNRGRRNLAARAARVPLPVHGQRRGRSVAWLRLPRRRRAREPESAATRWGNLPCPGKNIVAPSPPAPQRGRPERPPEPIAPIRRRAAARQYATPRRARDRALRRRRDGSARETTDHYVRVRRRPTARKDLPQR